MGGADTASGCLAQRVINERGKGMNTIAIYGLIGFVIGFAVVAYLITQKWGRNIRQQLRYTRFKVTHHWRRACEWLKWVGHREGSFERFARHELKLAGWFDKDGMYGDLMGRAVMRMAREFAEERHSGLSAPVSANLFRTLVRFEPLTPLTGDDSEWEEVNNDGTYQNKRCSRVFKDAAGAYDSQGRIFRTPDGGCYQSRDSRVYITFPYTPKIEYVDIKEDEA